MSVSQEFFSFEITLPRLIEWFNRQTPEFRTIQPSELLVIKVKAVINETGEPEFIFGTDQTINDPTRQYIGESTFIWQGPVGEGVVATVDSFLEVSKHIPNQITTKIYEGSIFIAEGDSEGLPPSPTCQWDVIGDECDGWWYVGDMEFGGVPYKILIGGAEYERGDLQWKTEQTATPGTYVFDGVLATDAMMESTSLHPAAEYCTSLGNGSYMPSIGEVQLLHINRGALGGMNLSGNYWSSSQSQADSTTVGRENARYLNYTTGSITGNYPKTSTLNLRPARRIPIL